MPQCAIHGPLKQCMLGRTRRFRMRESQQVAMRPAIALLALEHLASELDGWLIQVPTGDRGPEATAPATQIFDERGEITQVPSGPGDPRQSFERRGIGVRVAELRACA